MAQEATESASAKATDASRTWKSRFVSRITAPYFGAAVCAAAVMAWYFFDFVPGKLDYFVGLRFRTLAVASAQVKSKTENLARALQSGNESTTDSADYFSKLVPDLQLLAEAKPAADVAALQLAGGGQRAIVAWQDVVRPAAAVSQREFDDLILAGPDGKTLWQREQTTARIGNLKVLLSIEPEPSGWFSTSWQLKPTRVPDKARDIEPVPILGAVDFGGVPSYVFVQSVVPAAPGLEQPTPLYLAGIVSRQEMERQAMHIPVVWIVLFALPIILLFLGLPFIKLKTLTPKERYSFADVGLIGVAALWALSIGAILPFGPAAIDSSADETLARFADRLDERLAAETGKVLSVGAAIHQNALAISQSVNAPPHKGGDTDAHAIKDGLVDLWTSLKTFQAASSDLSLKAIVPGEIELDVVAWLDAAGNQKRKWTTKSMVTASVPHSPYRHFQDLRADHTYCLSSGSQVAFTIEPLRTPTTAQMGFIFAVRTSDLARQTTKAVETASASPAAPGPDAALPYLVLNVRPQSVVDPIVPPGYGFAFLDDTGRVLFHSQEGLSLAENFFEEVNNSGQVRDWTAAARKVTWSGDYHGRPHRLHVQPMKGFTRSNWRVVTFQESEPALNAQLHQHKAIVRMLALNTALVIAVALAFWVRALYASRRLRDILLFPLSPTRRGVWTLGGLVVVSAFVIVWTYQPTASSHLNELYFWFLLSPLLATCVALLARSGCFGDKPAQSAAWQNAEIVLLAVIVAVIPAVGFARIACRMQDTVEMERWLETARNSWVHRAERVKDRNRAAANSAATQKLLDAAPATAPLALHAASEPDYSYLTLLPRVQFAATDTSGKSKAETPEEDDPALGQKIVRRIVSWSPFLTREAPGDLKSRPRAESAALALTLPGSEVPLTTKLAAGMGGDLSTPRLVLGLLIVTSAIFALCWSRRKLTVPTFLRAPTLDDTLDGLPETGTEVVLLIGPPRTRKDQAVHDYLCHVDELRTPDRIRLLDKDPTEALIAKEIARIEKLVADDKAPIGPDGRVWLHVSNLEAQLATVASRSFALKLLERMTDQSTTPGERVVIVTSSVDPIANFQEVFADERQGTYTDVVPEVELSRSSLLLSRFRRCYLPTNCELTAEDRWHHWLNYQPDQWPTTIRLEAEGYEPLGEILNEITSTPWPIGGPSLDELSRTFMARAEAVYQLLWTSCTRSEKLVLIQLAQEGMVNPKCYEVVARLISKGLVVTTPGLSVFNFTFRRFLRGIERNQIVTEWEHMEGTGLWVTAGRLVGSSMILGGLFFFLTQDFPVQSLLPIVSGTGLFSLPLVRDLVSRLAGGRSGGGAQNA